VPRPRRYIDWGRKVIITGGDTSNIVRRVRQKLRNLRRRFPRNVVCNICGWGGHCFDGDNWHPYTICWKCRSQVRHRLFVEALKRIDGLTFGELLDAKRVLHFSPEEQTTGLLKPRAARYRTADLDRDDVDEKLDITAMPSVADGSVDLLVAADVLEHVPDHMQGMREIYRVLAPGGWAILTVPQQDHLEKTYSDPGITDPKERERLFGQSDHVRIFGDDMRQLLESVGFAVRVVDAGSFPPAVVKRHVLFPPVLSTHPLATNHRKVYFARRPL